MRSLHVLEEKLDEVFNKKAPVKLPENAKKTLAGAWWWIALVLGILQLWGAWALWQLAHYLDPLDRTVDAVNEYFGYTVIDDNLNLFYYLAVIVLVVDAVILLLATPGLKAFQKAGWNLLFYSLLLNLAYGIVRAFSDAGGGVMPLIWTLVVTAVTAFFVFQVRDYFKATAHKPTPQPTKPSKE